jgi:predicted RNA-binding protein YlxR (DUF448 family)
MAASAKTRRTPQRTCVACREVLSKRSLIRLVRTSAGVEIDPTGKKAGRGAYLHDQRSCWEKALKDDLLERALKTTLSDTERERLRAHGSLLPDAA